MLEQAIVLHKAGRYAEAQRLYQDILRHQPKNAHVVHLLGQLALDAGAPQAARPILEHARLLDPRNPAAHNDLGRSLLMMGMAQDALPHFDHALALDPKLAAAHSNRSLALCNLARLEEALVGFERAMTLAPNNPQVHSNFGINLVRMGRNEEALARFESAVALAPNDPALHYNLADTLKNLRRDDEALTAYGRAIKLAPEFVEAWFNQGLLLARMERFTEALTSIDRALALSPTTANMIVKRGLVLARLGRTEEALVTFDQAIAAAPDFVDGYCARLLLLARLHGVENALAYGREIARDPGLKPDIEFNMAQLLLQQGRWEESWPLYESRKNCTRPTETRAYSQPIWLGETPLEAKTLFVYAEQGLGDVILFSRYLSLAKAQGAHVIFSPYDGLARLMKGLVPDVPIVPWQTAPEQFDYHMPLLSMPLAFRTGTDTAPAPIPYLQAEDGLVKKWQNRIGPTGFKIGINWSGGIYITNASFGLERAFPLRLLAPLAQLAGVRLISLQKESANRELAALPVGMNVETLGEDFDSGPDSFIDTAAAMQMMDLIISCDTSVAHLAGALGRPIWLALSASPEWRWLRERTDSPWYPTMTLFRQITAGDWANVFAQMEERLAALLKDR